MLIYLIRGIFSDSCAHLFDARDVTPKNQIEKCGCLLRDGRYVSIFGIDPNACFLMPEPASAGSG